jgi:hypothetical protein
MDVVYCRNGHYTSSYNRTAQSLAHATRMNAEEERDDAPHKSKFCGICGAANLVACEHCHALIKPLTERGGKPGYCIKCGKPYPWTVATLVAAKEYTEELEELSSEDKAALIATFDDLVVDTPRAELAAHRFKRLIRKSGPVATDFLTKLLVEISSSTVAKIIKP